MEEVVRDMLEKDKQLKYWQVLSEGLVAMKTNMDIPKGVEKDKVDLQCKNGRKRLELKTSKTNLHTSLEGKERDLSKDQKRVVGDISREDLSRSGKTYKDHGQRRNYVGAVDGQERR